MVHQLCRKNKSHWIKDHRTGRHLKSHKRNAYVNHIEVSSRKKEISELITWNHMEIDNMELDLLKSFVTWSRVLLFGQKAVPKERENVKAVSWRDNWTTGQSKLTQSERKCGIFLRTEKKRVKEEWKSLCCSSTCEISVSLVWIRMCQHAERDYELTLCCVTCYLCVSEFSICWWWWKDWLMNENKLEVKAEKDVRRRGTQV